MPPEKHNTAMIALGSAELMKGFSLIGFETISNATVNDLSRLISRLLSHKQRALLIVEQSLAREGSEILQPVLTEGGGIIIVEVPPITNPDDLVSTVSNKVKLRLGDSALREST